MMLVILNLGGAVSWSFLTCSKIFWASHSRLRLSWILALEVFENFISSLPLCSPISLTGFLMKEWLRAWFRLILELGTGGIYTVRLAYLGSKQVDDEVVGLV